MNPKSIIVCIELCRIHTYYLILVESGFCFHILIRKIVRWLLSLTFFSYSRWIVARTFGKWNLIKSVVSSQNTKLTVFTFSHSMRASWWKMTDFPLRKNGRLWSQWSYFGLSLRFFLAWKLWPLSVQRNRGLLSPPANLTAFSHQLFK